MQLSDLDVYAQWVEEIKYDTLDNCWIAKVYPGKTIKGDFTFIANTLAQFVHHEVLQLIADLFKVNCEQIIAKDRAKHITHIRWSAILVLERRFNGTMNLIAKSVGYSTHVAMYNAREKALLSPEVKNLVQRIYRAYPWLYRRKTDIK